MRDGLGYRPRIAIAGTGISGLSAAWLLSPHFDVTIYEAASRLGGHSNTVDVDLPHGRVPVDTGFIVYNEHTYPNLTALFAHLDVATTGTIMSFAASRGSGSLEYNGETLNALFGQRSNIFRPRFWSMLADLVRFYRQAPEDLDGLEVSGLTLGAYLRRKGYRQAFIEDHLLPMAGAIWSSPAQRILEYPAASFIRFQENHGLLKLTGRPIWRTVAGGSRVYVEKMASQCDARIRLNCPVNSVTRVPHGVVVRDGQGQTDTFDHIIFATQADQALAALADATPTEREILGEFSYSDNETWLHSDETWMPQRKSVWGSWNYIERCGDKGEQLCVTYWMNRLQPIQTDTQMFVTLNPATPPRADLAYHREHYRHPIFDKAAIEAQKRLWTLQGGKNTWFCGSYFGAGFHEDGLQSGLAVAEQLGGVRRPWTVPNESGRIWLDPALQRRHPRPVAA
jgi:predicted NAD/FAD-binding protein